MANHNGAEPQLPPDPFQNPQCLAEHIFQFGEDAYLALKILISRLPEPTHFQIASQLLQKATTFCQSQNLLSKLKTFNPAKVNLKAEKYGIIFLPQQSSSSPSKQLSTKSPNVSVPDPFQCNDWNMDGKLSYYLLKMLLTRLPSSIRASLSSSLLMHLIGIIPWSQLHPFNPALCKMRKFWISDEREFVAPSCLLHSPLSDPFADPNAYWNVLSSDNIYPLLKQLLARCQSHVRKNLSLKLLKASIHHLVESDLWRTLDTYDRSKSNHLGHFTFSGQLPVNTELGSDLPQVHPSPHIPFFACGFQCNQHQDGQKTFIKAPQTKPGPSMIPVAVTVTSSIQPNNFSGGHAQNHVPLSANPQRECDTTNLSASGSQPESLTFDPQVETTPSRSSNISLGTNFDWARTPSDYYVSNGPLKLRDTSVPSNYDWAQLPSDADSSYDPERPIVIRVASRSDVKQCASQGQHNVSSCTGNSRDHTPTNLQSNDSADTIIDEDFNWAQTPTNASIGYMPPQNSIVEYEQIFNESAKATAQMYQAPSMDKQPNNNLSPRTDQITQKSKVDMRHSKQRRQESNTFEGPNFAQSRNSIGTQTDSSKRSNRGRENKSCSYTTSETSEPEVLFPTTPSYPIPS